MPGAARRCPAQPRPHPGRGARGLRRARPGRAAGGIATLYRRFPTREALVAATFELKLDAFAEAAEQALGHPDAWAGFAGFVEWACATQAANRGVTDLLTLRLPNSELAEASRARGLRAFTALVRPAQLRPGGAGNVRPQPGQGDLPRQCRPRQPWPRQRNPWQREPWQRGPRQREPRQREPRQREPRLSRFGPQRLRSSGSAVLAACPL